MSTLSLHNRMTGFGAACALGLLLAFAGSTAAQAAGPALEAVRGEVQAESNVNWSAGIVATKDGLVVDSRAASAKPSKPTTDGNPSSVPTKNVINPTTLNGHWFNPAQSGHGFTFTFVERPNGTTTFVVTWYTYRNGAQVWILGSGDLIGNTATVPAVIASGGQFPPNFVPGSVTSTG